MAYSIRALGSMNGYHFSGWAEDGPLPKTYNLIRSPETPKPLTLHDAQGLKKALIQWVKTLSGITLSFHLTPLEAPAPRQIGLVPPAVLLAHRKSGSSA